MLLPDKQTKMLVNSWIAGDKDLVDEKIEFMRYARVGHLSLFNQDGTYHIFVLKLLRPWNSWTKKMNDLTT